LSEIILLIKFIDYLEVGRGTYLKNIILVAFIFCLTVISAYFMMTTDNNSKD